MYNVMSIYISTKCHFAYSNEQKYTIEETMIKGPEITKCKKIQTRKQKV